MQSGPWAAFAFYMWSCTSDFNTSSDEPLATDALRTNPPKLVRGHQENEQPDRDGNADSQRAKHASRAATTVAEQKDKGGGHRGHDHDQTEDDKPAHCCILRAQMSTPDLPLAASGRRFRPRLWAVLLTATFVVITIRLGNWQGDRAAWRLSQQAQLTAASEAPPLTAHELPTAAREADALRYRRIRAQGRFLPDQQFLLDNRIQDGHAGFAVLQVLALQGTEGGTRDANPGQYVLVDRGWVAAPADRSKLPSIDTPVGMVNIEGRINQPASRNPGTLDNGPGRLLNYIELDALSHRAGVSLRPWLLEQSAGPGFVGGTRPAPGANHEKNLIYQMQWYAFAGLAVVLFVVLSFRPRSAQRVIGVNQKESR